ncbi:MULTISPECIES: DoxX family protein [Novosphingobium]|nr:MULTISPECIES: DoxX family protein [Novosphingobium]MBB3478647.1 putative oxidoreductase [Novosphingobium sp. BK369]MBB3621731.1 putative oxidoreductase [Novosphingobium sp. BK592]NOX06452.1 putative oxidoreductase [Novosphingobium sp. SG754]PTR11361.1 putative oxidoreductase [Novosphingobium sp. GV055]PUB04142.1 putative oxidoreductase [Novosphingobium sp. GV061]
MNTIAALAGRILLSLLFIISGMGKLFDVSGTQVALAGVGLTPDLALPVGLFELIGGLALMFGVATRIFAVLLAGFTLLTILFFHHNLLDHTQVVEALKNLAIAGGLLALFAHRQVAWSYDGLRNRRDRESAARDAEMRAARAEGRAEALSEMPVVETPATRVETITDVDGHPTGTVAVARRKWWQV